MPYQPPPPEPTLPPLVQTVQSVGTVSTSPGQLLETVALGAQGITLGAVISRLDTSSQGAIVSPAIADPPVDFLSNSGSVQRSQPPQQMSSQENERIAQAEVFETLPTGEHDTAPPATPTLPPQLDTETPDTPTKPEDPDRQNADEILPAPAAAEPDLIEAEEDIEAPDGNPEETPESIPVYPSGATPEPLWFNGAVVEGGDLLPPSLPTTAPGDVLDLRADSQEFEPATQILRAEGNVVLRLRNGILSGDRLWVNIANRFVLAEGNVVFTRGAQTIEAERGEYNLLQGSGSLFQASGTLFLPGIETDFAPLGEPVGTGFSGATENILRRDPITNVQGTGTITFGAGVSGNVSSGVPTADAGGFVRRLRFEADRVDFDAEGWYLEGIRVTNDPFSPPELEFRGNTARLTRLTELQDELFVENARLVFDQGFTVPLLRSSVLLTRGGSDEVNPLFFSIGYDGDDRDGLFIERSFRVATIAPWALTLTPQLLVNRFVSGDRSNFLSNLGLEADLTGALSPTTTVTANASFSGLDLENLEERLRASVRVQQALGTHSLNLEYSYRDRLFNGSLGFQDVQSSVGLVFLSPTISLGNTGINLTYQASAQYITADTDRPDLLEPVRDNNRVSLGRFQGSASLSRGFLLWQGQPLPATPDEGMRFTPRSVVPNLQLILAGRGTFTYYTSEDTQESLSALVGIVGELGHFSKDFFDSTSFNLTYQRSFIGDGASPFLFDRDVDQNVISGGILQQIYGPFRLGFQTSFNLDTGDVINTDYVLEYSRRTYSIVLRYSPTQLAGFVGFRLNEFDWAGRAPAFGGADIRQVEGGVVRE